MLEQQTSKRVRKYSLGASIAHVILGVLLFMFVLSLAGAIYRPAGVAPDYAVGQALCGFAAVIFVFFAAGTAIVAARSTKICCSECGGETLSDRKRCPSCGRVLT